MTNDLKICEIDRFYKILEGALFSLVVFQLNSPSFCFLNQKQFFLWHSCTNKIYI